MTSMPVHVLVFGTFDVLHPGHRNFFQQARALGDKLSVVVARDKTVRTVKGFQPEQNETERLQAVAACPEVDQAVLGREDQDKYAIIEQIRPDIIALGYDQAHFAERLPQELLARGLSARIIRLKPYKPEQYKSSLLRKQPR